MTDREIIEHWALRDALVRWTYIVLAELLAAIACIVGAATFAGAALLLPALCMAAAAFLSHLRLRRIWRRIHELEQFIR